MPNIALIEDSQSDALIFKLVLEEQGFNGKLEIFPDGQRALKALESNNEREKLPNIILLDLGLPGLSGHEVLMELRKNLALKDVPIIILTSSDNPNDREVAMQNGATMFMTKPLDLEGYGEIADRLLKIDIPRLLSKESLQQAN